ncbi:MAG: Endonuclease/exonuclease/phosphatase, partial [uncultured Acidimicrobiales bacterium]
APGPGPPGPRVGGDPEPARCYRLPGDRRAAQDRPAQRRLPARARLGSAAPRDRVVDRPPGARRRVPPGDLGERHRPQHRRLDLRAPGGRWVGLGVRRRTLPRAAVTRPQPPLRLGRALPVAHRARAPPPAGGRRPGPLRRVDPLGAPPCTDRRARRLLDAPRGATDGRAPPAPPGPRHRRPRAGHQGGEGRGARPRREADRHAPDHLRRLQRRARQRRDPLPHLAPRPRGADDLLPGRVAGGRGRPRSHPGLADQPHRRRPERPPQAHRLRVRGRPLPAARVGGTRPRRTARLPRTPDRGARQRPQRPRGRHRLARPPQRL